MTTNTISGPVVKQRNRNYEQTHRLLIEKASELIVHSGADGVSVSALSRVTGINRSTIYYHFDTREALMSAAQSRLRDTSPHCAENDVSRWVGIDQMSDFFRSNPDVVAAWIDENMAVGDIRGRYPQWDRLVSQIGDAFAELTSEEPYDPEVYCALMMTGALAAPRTFANSAHPLDSLERILHQLHCRSTPAADPSTSDWPAFYQG